MDDLPTLYGMYIKECPHPRSGQAHSRYAFECIFPIFKPVSDEILTPWRLFQSEEEFEWAEWIVNSSMSAADVDFFMKGLHNGKWIKNGELNMQFTNAEDIFNFVDKVASVYEKVCRYFLVQLA